MEQSRVLLLLVPVPNISLRHRCGSVYSESIFSSFLSCVAHIRAHREAVVSLCAPCFFTLSFDRLQRLLGRRKNLAVPRLHYRRQGGQDTVNTVEICLHNDAGPGLTVASWVFIGEWTHFCHCLMEVQFIYFRR